MADVTDILDKCYVAHLTDDTFDLAIYLGDGLCRCYDGFTVDIVDDIEWRFIMDGYFEAGREQFCSVNDEELIVYFHSIWDEDDGPDFFEPMPHAMKKELLLRFAIK